MGRTQDNLRSQAALLLVFAVLALVGAHSAHQLHMPTHFRSVRNTADVDPICSNPYLPLFGNSFVVPAARRRLEYLPVDDSVAYVHASKSDVPITRPPPVSL